MPEPGPDCGVPLDHPTVAKVLAASPPPRQPTADPERQRLLASMAHHLLQAEQLPASMSPTERATVTAERQLRGLEASGWAFARPKREPLV